MTYQTPTTIPAGTTVEFKDTVAIVAPIEDSWLLDHTPWNNVNTYSTDVIASYDPNYKSNAKRVGENGDVELSVANLNTIHFQNEGTYFAQKVVITDQLDEDLDWTTFRPGYSEYPYTATVVKQV